MRCKIELHGQKLDRTLPRALNISYELFLFGHNFKSPGACAIRQRRESCCEHDIMLEDPVLLNRRTKI